MSGFNLSDWALRHRSLVVFLALVVALAGLRAYATLGREEDPPFTMKVMVVKALWPGATATETVQQVTDRIERKLEELPGLDFVRSYTKPGEAVVFVTLRDDVPAADVPDRWYQVRKKIGDIARELPSGIQGPFFNDEFGDTYSIIYAFTGDGFSPRALRDQVERVRADVLRVPDVGKADLIGVQDEKVWLEFSPLKFSALGLDVAQIKQILQNENALAPSGTIDAGSERIAVRVTGAFASEAALGEVTFRQGDRMLKLSDIATIRRGHAEPAQPQFRWNGQPALGLAITMRAGGNAEALGHAIRHQMALSAASLPVGIEAHLAADQPQVVHAAVGAFTEALWEAIAIVLAVSFLALGWRPGIVVAVAIPLVLAITFAAMSLLDISLQRISLGALIIALGLLVDDAMITVEMMMTKLEEGMDRLKAAAFAYTSTAFPMLTGTLVTIAGFVPVGFARSGAGEYCFTLFVVVLIALLASWVVAVLFTPLAGVLILPAKAHAAHGPSRGMRAFRALLAAALRRPVPVLAATAALFAVSLGAMRLVPQQFFPASDRPELLVNLTLPQGAAIAETGRTVERVEALLKGDPDIDHWTFHVGQGAVRFYLPLDAQLANEFFAQAVVVTRGPEARARVQARLERALATGFDTVMARVSPLELGPPVGWPIKFRLSGPDAGRVRDLALDFARTLGADPDVRGINQDWNEPAKAIRIDVDQDRARLLGLSSRQVADVVNAILSGTTITQLRDATYLVDVVARAVPEERQDAATLQALRIMVPGGQGIPLAQFATIGYEIEPPMIWRRQRLPTVTVQADTAPGVEADTVTKRLGPAVAAFRAALPPGYAIVAGGTAEDSARAQSSIFAVFPAMLLLIATILMVQLMSFQRLALVLLTAPLALIGVVGALLAAGRPMGFVAILGVISLIGMVIRNAVILIDQVDHQIARGDDPWEAVLDATTHRLRPILLTAAAAILGMIPIAPTVFWGPMAFAVMGGLAVATLLTLVVLPALYVAWFGIGRPGTTLAADPAPAH